MHARMAGDRLTGQQHVFIHFKVLYNIITIKSGSSLDATLRSGATLESGCHANSAVCACACVSFSSIIRVVTV